MKLSIIIPVFNEQKTVREIIKRVSAIKIKNVKIDITVVDDGSTDKTLSILKEISRKNHKFKLIEHEKNSGKGAAVRTGIEGSNGDYIIIQDADLEYDPIYYLKLLQPFESNQVDVVYGSRLINYPLNLWGKKKTVLPSHLIANRLLTSFTNLLYQSNLTDMETGYKVFRKKILDNIMIKSNKFDFEAEITAKILKKGVKIVEIPIITKPRSYKEGKKIGWQDGVSAIWTLIKYRFIE